jgi:hypothetical protein
MLDRYGDEIEEPNPQDVVNCFLCDDYGYRKPRQGPDDSCAQGVVCDHFDYAAASRRGMEMIRAALNKEKK